MMTASSRPFVKRPADLNPRYLPQHVAVIMDGNGRWAQQQGRPRVWGHRRGVDTLKELLRCCKDWGIGHLTAYAFSTENWGRPANEVEFLMMLFERVLRAELAEMQAEGVRIRFVGALHHLPQSLQDEIALAMEQTQVNDAVHFTIATNYGGREEIVHACRQLALQVQSGDLDPEHITEELFAQHLYTRDIKDPDLLIRTSGEQRLSNYLLWQMAYTEQYFTPICWPDFGRPEFHAALLDYQSRHRRFGKV